MMANAKSNSLNTLSLFSGAGGLDLGFAAAGYSILASVDIDTYSCQTLEYNKNYNGFFKNHIVLNEDIINLSLDKIQKDHNISITDIDVIIGGPPCQAFSVFGRRGGLKDPRGKLIWEFIRLINEANPDLFVFENVSGIKSIDNGKVYKAFLDKLSKGSSYKISEHCYDLANYGIPQHRRRVFIIGAKNIMIPEMVPTHGGRPTIFSLKPFVTAGDALRGMPEPCEGVNVPNHIGRKHSQRIIERYKKLKLGERDPVTRINKLDPCRPSFTIIVGSDAGGGKGHVHPYSPREVTPRESARMQTFPDWWKFSGTGRHVIRQVGNAVPPLFAALLANHIKEFIIQKPMNFAYDDFIEILELDYLKKPNDN